MVTRSCTGAAKIAMLVSLPVRWLLATNIASVDMVQAVLARLLLPSDTANMENMAVLPVLLPSIIANVANLPRALLLLRNDTVVANENTSINTRVSRRI